MENKHPVKDKVAYLVSWTLRAESAIFGSGCGSLGALEQHLPDIFVRSVEEPAQSLVLRRIELPHVEAPSLARENLADEQDRDYVDELELLVCRCSGNGGPQTCLPAACGVAQGVARYGPSSLTQAQDPREGPSLAGRTTESFLRGSLNRQAHEEAERSRQGYLARCS